MKQTNIRWNSSATFIFSTSAAAIGLGNIWRFPYMVGQHGGGTFVLLYIACILVLGIPLLLAEITIGRLGRSTPPQTFALLAQKAKLSPLWKWAGIISVCASFFILSYYLVITGWVIEYITKASLNQFHHLTSTKSTELFNQLQHNPAGMLVTDTIAIISSSLIVALGIKKGLEKMILYMFPTMFILLILLFIYACSIGDIKLTLHYLFDFNPKELTMTTLLMALGQAFFSLSIGVGANIMLSAYLPKQVSLLSATAWVVIADTLFAILSGLIIFPLVFKYNLATDSGPSLIFQTLPLAFGWMHLGYLFGVLFFILLFFAAFSSIVAILETIIATVAETTSISRKKSNIYTSSLLWLISILTIGSFSHPEYFQVLGHTAFGIIDHITAAIMLPVSGLLSAIFLGWLFPKAIFKQELQWNTSGFWHGIWRIALRYIAPISIILILITNN